MSLPHYSKYKDSGENWLGNIPAHWILAPLKRSFQIIGGSTPKSDKPEYWDGSIVWVSPADLSKLPSFFIDDSAKKITDDGLASCGTTLVPPGSIVLSTRAPIGLLAIATTSLCTNQGCKTLVPRRDIHAQYFAYQLLAYTDELNIRGRGTTFLELSADELAAFKVPRPCYAEQTAIATFLNCETAKIDELIAEQKKLIALLAEKRQATISHAITKGLNPDVQMKDSGVAWLGEVPKHWHVVRIKRVVEAKDGTHATPQYVTPTDDSFPLITSKDFGPISICFDEAKHISRNDHLEIVKRSNTERGDVLMSMIGGNIGKALIVDTEHAFSIKNVALFKTNASPCLAKYLLYYLQSGLLDIQVDLLSRGGAQGFLGLGDIRNLIFFKMPMEEMQLIVQTIDERLAPLNQLGEAAKLSLKLLNERRSAIIYAAVTGKIDVRQAASRSA